MRGFTLLETLITVVIFAFLVGGITQVLNVGNLTFPIDIGQMELQQQSRLAMQWMTRELRQASRVDSPVPVNADSDQVSFDSGGNSGIIYYLNASKQIIREFPSGSRKILANNITRLKFTLANSLLKIEVGAAQTIMNKALIFSLKEQVKLRNG